MDFEREPPVPFLSAWYLVMEVVVRTPCTIQEAGMLSLDGYMLPLAAGESIPGAAVYVLPKEQSQFTLDQIIEYQLRLCYLEDAPG